MGNRAIAFTNKASKSIEAMKKTLFPVPSHKCGLLPKDRLDDYAPQRVSECFVVNFFPRHCLGIVLFRATPRLLEFRPEGENSDLYQRDLILLSDWKFLHNAYLSPLYINKKITVRTLQCFTLFNYGVNLLTVSQCLLRYIPAYLNFKNLFPILRDNV